MGLWKIQETHYKFKTNLTDSICIPAIPKKTKGVDLLVNLAYIFFEVSVFAVPGFLSCRKETPFYILISVGFFECTKGDKASFSCLKLADDSPTSGVFEHCLIPCIFLMWRGYFLDLVLCLYSLRFPYTKTQSGYLTYGVRYPDKLTRKSKGV